MVFLPLEKKLRQSPSEVSVSEKIITPSENAPAGSSPIFAQIAHLSAASPSMRIEFPSGICLQISNACDKQLLHEAIVADQIIEGLQSLHKMA